MARGGARPGAGVKSTWKHGKTRTIRVPIVLADELMRIARYMDENGLLEYDTGSNILDLSGISIRQYQGAASVYLEDLARAGFRLQPESLAEMIKAKMARSQEVKGLVKYGRRL